MKRSPRLVVAALVLATASACGAAPGGASELRPTSQRVAVIPAAHVQAAQRLTVGRSAWISVSVARLWLSPSAPWQVDAPALTAPVHFRTWLRAMTLSQRRALDQRSDTEALLGDRVVVIGLRRHWAKVVVPSQPSQKNSRGYPGWVPRRQLTAAPQTRTAQVATVVSRTAWLRTDDSAVGRVTKISFGTRLAVLGQVPGYVRVATPKGKVRRLALTAVSTHARGTPALAAGRSALVSTAKKFLGLPYLWGGLSGFGLDCSGLTWLDYRVHGIKIPRDALPQSQHGTPVSTRAPGDLLFYANDGRVHHVTMYIGDGQIIQAPRTGRSVEVIGFSDPPLRSEYVGARRYLP